MKHPTQQHKEITDTMFEPLRKGRITMAVAFPIDFEKVLASQRFVVACDSARLDVYRAAMEQCCERSMCADFMGEAMALRNEVVCYLDWEEGDELSSSATEIYVWNGVYFCVWSSGYAEGPFESIAIAESHVKAERQWMDPLETEILFTQNGAHGSGRDRSSSRAGSEDPCWQSTRDAGRTTLGFDSWDISVEYSELEQPWCDIPQWVSFLIQFGYRWEQSRTDGCRRLAIISMPCESAAAGLIALGAIRRRLESPDATDRGRHFERLKALVQPINGARNSVSHYVRPGRFFVRWDARASVLWACERRCPTSMISITPESALKWRITGEAPVDERHGETLDLSLYAELLPNHPAIHAETLQASDSEMCLAGAGGSVIGIEHMLSQIRFRTGTLVTDLKSILTTQQWSPNAISRLRLWNLNTKVFDRSTGPPQLTVAAGDRTFLAVLADEDGFQQCDLVGVIDRTKERDRLDAVGEAVGAKLQWYDLDQTTSELFGQPPHGMTLLVLKKRT